MKEGMKTIFLNLVSSFLYFIIFGIVTSVISMIVSVVVVIRKANDVEVPLYLWALFVGTVLLNLVNIVINIINLIRRPNKPSFPAIKPEVKYDFIKTQLFFDTREHIKCYREVKFKILVEKMEHIRKQFTWTGDGYKGTYLEVSRTKEHFTIDDSIRKYPPQIYDVIFNKVKKRGDTVQYVIRSEVEDLQHVMKPFLSQHITSPTKKLVIKVVVPTGMINGVKFSVYADNSCKIQIGDSQDVIKENIGEMDVYEKEVKNPQLLYIYQFDWEFDNEKKL